MTSPVQRLTGGIDSQECGDDISIANEEDLDQIYAPRLPDEVYFIRERQGYGE